MSSTQIDKILNIYKRLCLIPSFTSARIIPKNKNGLTVQSLWSQKNLERRTKQKFIREFSFNAELQPLVESFPIDVSTELLSAYSNDETLKAILRDVTVDGKPKQFVEIWNDQYLNKSYDLSAFDVHGDVYVDPTFSAFQWSPDNTRLLYVAEKKLTKSEPFYKQKPKPNPKSDKSENEDEPSRGTEYAYKPDWGEQLVGTHRSVIVVLNVNDDTIVPITSIPDDYFPAQVVWAPNGNDIIGVAYKLKPRYLGLYACTNRESYIFHLKETEFCKITSEGLFCSSPRLSPDGKNLIWLERDMSPAHHNVHRLMNLKLDNSEKPEILVDVVKTHRIINEGKKFYGFYNFGLPKRCWSGDSKFIFLSTPQRSNAKTYIVNLETKSLTEIDNNDDSSLIIVDANDKYLAFVNYSLTKPPQLMITKFDSSSSRIGKFNFVPCTISLKIPDGEDFMYEHMEYVYDTDEAVRDFNFTYFGKKSGPNQSVPLIAIGHGGPHVSFSNTFSPECTLYALLGFGILQINYRGSTGLGGDNVEYLLGKVGEKDVLDCITAIDLTLKKYPWLDSERVNVWGGSHGGFLGAHLTGQYPEKFKSAILLNPVIDLVAMFSTTDIPDWCHAECGYSFFENQKQTTDNQNYGEIMMKMLQHSPIVHVDKVKTPTLLLLGSKDLRVPFSQGKLWYNRLIENKVETKLFVYEDNHSLRKDDVDIDSTINSALWLIEHNEKS